jgi:CBS domain-containing protein
MMCFGVLSVFAGGIGQGIWLLLIGWFLDRAARASYETVRARVDLQGVPVRRVMWAGPPHVSPSLSLDRFVQIHVLTGDQAAYPVVSDGALVGMVTRSDVRKAPQVEWPHTAVGAVMTPLGEVEMLSPDADAFDALEALARRDVEQIPVVDGRRLEGIVRRRDLLRWLALQRTPAQSGA